MYVFRLPKCCNCTPFEDTSGKFNLAQVHFRFFAQTAYSQLCKHTPPTHSHMYLQRKTARAWEKAWSGSQSIFKWSRNGSSVVHKITRRLLITYSYCRTSFAYAPSGSVVLRTSTHHTHTPRTALEACKTRRPLQTHVAINRIILQIQQTLVQRQNRNGDTLPNSNVFLFHISLANASLPRA